MGIFSQRTPAVIPAMPPQALTTEAEIDEQVSLPAVPSTRVAVPQAAQPAAAVGAAPAKKGPMTEEEELLARAEVLG